MTRIHLLSPQLANQIAAGEVVEPSRIRSERVAGKQSGFGADRVDLDIEQGGVKLIRSA